MYGLGGLEQVEVVKRRRKAKWLEEKEKEEKEKTKDRSVPDGSDNYVGNFYWDALYYHNDHRCQLSIGSEQRRLVVEGIFTLL